MKGKKKLLADFLGKSRLLRLFGLLPVNVLIIINYHRIYAGNTLQTNFDTGVFGPSAEEFDQHMAFLSQHADLLSEEDVVSLAETGAPIANRSVLITFDDGYLDNYELALPLLRKYQVPAVFFIPITPIEKSRLGWWDIIAYFVKHTNKEKIFFEGDAIPLRMAEDKERAIRTLLKYMKSAKFEESRDMLTRLSALCEVDFPSVVEQSEQLMSWDQIKEIADTDLLSIGSHTVSHRVMATISDEDELNELQESKAFLEQKLGREIKSIGYPVGGYDAFSDRTKKNARKAGYRIGFSFNTGVNYGKITDPYDIKRIGPAEDLPTYNSTVILPKVFA